MSQRAKFLDFKGLPDDEVRRQMDALPVDTFVKELYVKGVRAGLGQDLANALRKYPFLTSFCLYTDIDKMKDNVDCLLTPQDVAALGDALHANEFLTRLCIVKYWITDITPITELIPKLTELDLSGSWFAQCEEWSGHLASALERSDKIKRLCLCDIPFTNRDVRRIAEVVKYHTTLKYLNVLNCFFSQSATVYWEQMLRVNRSLQSFLITILAYHKSKLRPIMDALDENLYIKYVFIDQRYANQDDNDEYIRWLKTRSERRKRLVAVCNQAVYIAVCRTQDMETDVQPAAQKMGETLQSGYRSVLTAVCATLPDGIGLDLTL